MNIHIRYNTFENIARKDGTGYITPDYRKDADTPTYSRRPLAASGYTAGNRWRSWRLL